MSVSAVINQQTVSSPRIRRRRGNVSEKVINFLPCSNIP